MFKSGKTWAWVIGVLLFLGVAFTAGWHFFKKDLANPQSKIVKPIVTDQLKKMINEATDGLYHITYDKFDLDIDAGKGLITNFKLIADTAVYKQLLANHKAPNNIFSVHMDSLILNKFGFDKSDSAKMFRIKAVTIKHPYITIINKRQTYNDTTKDGKSLLKTLAKKILNATAVEKMTMTNTTLVYINKNEAEEKSTTLKHWNINVADFNIDKVTGDNKDTTKNNRYIKVGRCQIFTPDSLYRLDFKNMRLLPQERSMYLSQFVLEPRLNKVAFYKKSGFDRDRFHFIYNQMWMKNIDIERFLQRQQIHVGKMVAGSSWSEVFNNYHWPRRIRPIRNHVYPQEKLQQLAFDVTIDTIAMHNGFFKYSIAAQRSESTATLTMNHIESRIYNVTNNTLAKKRNPFTICTVSNLIMGAAPMQGRYVFNLVNKNGAFSASIHMGKMDAQVLNPLAAPLGLMAVKAGTINKMYMHINGNEQVARGNVDLYYQGLKINLLKHDDKTDTLKKRGFLSFVTNAVLPNDNPKKNGKFRKGPIYVLHDKRMSFFGLLWKCSQDGMSSAMMGIDQKKDKPDENIAIKVIKKVFKPLQKQKKLKKDHDSAT